MTLADVPAGNIGGLPGGYQAMAPSDAPATLEKIISNTVGFFTVVGGLTFIIYLVLAGLTWITAREDDARLSKAKQMFTNALVGLAMIVISWALAGIIGTIFGFDILNPAQYIEQISPGGGNGGTDCGGGLNIGECGPLGGYTYCCVDAGTLCNGSTFSYPFNCRQDWIGH